ncbi:ribonuclease Z [Candidatus Pacearchaeota archaeon]|nr:ribonuclease Z [Candidatus Pacearchaeota archaeon]
MAEKIKITFLGTSAQIPTAKRNHTAVLLSYKDENILIDCGEGTQRQFRIARLNPCKITRILLTHKHGDHTFGLPGLISTLNASGYNKTLYIYGPQGIKKYLENMFKLINYKLDFKIEIKEVSGKFFDLGEFYLEAEKMEHGIPTNAYNFVLRDKIRIDKKKLLKSKLPAGPLLKKIQEGKDVVYNGKKYLSRNLTYLEKGRKISFVFDTLKNKKISKLVKNSDLFICESSFLENSENGEQLAKEHMHLTAKQVAEIAKKAKVRELILTHISSRYDQYPEAILDEAKSIFKNSKIAKDLDKFEV